jgi:hypothetical protein
MTTASLFNDFYSLAAPVPAGPAPAGIKRIVIVGRSSAAAIRCFPGTRSWPAWESSPTRRSCAPRARRKYGMAEIDNLITRSAGNYPDHKSALARIAPRRREPGLQIYFW